MNVKYPKGETVWVSYQNVNGEPVCILTSKQTRDYYYLYEVLPDGTLNKLGKARLPTELEEKFDVRKRMRGTDKPLFTNT